MAPDVDYKALGFQCGLEIHQQLATTKLFCRCRTDLEVADDDAPDVTLVRRLRPTQSELGEVDAAALAEARRHRLFEYRGFRHLSCLVEADEEPPHPVSEEALDVCLTGALLFGSDAADEVQWMRKIVIDGSNTSGFQRTGLVARGGSVDGVGIQSICLEEDSCRRIRDEADRVIWGLDRLGVPLIEVATAPTIRDGDHARAVAARIGALLRSTGRVKRGLGTIRQDLNVSIRDGTRIEVKGVQELNAISRVIEWEVRRQRRLVEVARTLQERRISAADYEWSPVDCSALFFSAQAGFLKKTLAAGGIVLGHRLPGLHGLLGAPRKEDPRLGRELAAYAKRDGGVQGLLHGDELPGMGITEAEVAAVRSRLGCGPQDSFALVAERPAVAERALRVVVQRAARALEGVPPEVRNAEPDYSSSYMRPMPGSARMYPETDIPPTLVRRDRLDRLRGQLPPPPERQVADLRSRHGISQEEAQQLVAEGLQAEFTALAKNGEASLAARLLLAVLPDLVRRYPETAPRHADWAKMVIEAVQGGRFAKEGVPLVLETLAQGQAATVEEAAAKRGLGGADQGQLEARARVLVEERIDFVRQRGRESVGPLMGVLMKEFRGRIDGSTINSVLQREVDRALEKTEART